MGREVIRTVYHFKDDKGWEYEKIVEGDIIPARIYRISAKTSCKDLPVSINEPPSSPVASKYYKFDLCKESFEHFSLFYYIKHLFYEMN